MLIVHTFMKLLLTTTNYMSVAVARLEGGVRNVIIAHSVRK